MKSTSRPKKQPILFAVMLAGVILAGSLSASAVPLLQLQRIQVNQTFTGHCCFPLVQAVGVKEPSAVTSVIVTFSADYNNSNEWFLAGLSVNNGPCMTNFGPGGFEILNVTNQFSAKTFRWIVEPVDGLIPGAFNTFAVCGGGAFTSGAHITLGQRTLSVEIGK